MRYYMHLFRQNQFKSMLSVTMGTKGWTSKASEVTSKAVGNDVNINFREG